MVFCLSIIAPAIIVAPAQADTLDDIISETNAVYQFLDDTNKADIRAARSNLQTKDIDWDSILSPLLTDQVIEKFDGSEETAREKAKIAVEKFITATTEILYSQDADELKNTLIDYKNNNPEFKEFFQTLFGIGITLDDLYNFLSDTRAKLPDVISIADAPILANGNNQELINKIPKYMVDAMELAKELPANTQFNGKLAALGWSSKELVDQMQALAAVIDPDSKAQLAFALAAVRSETKMISPATVTVGQTPTFTIKIMGIDVTNFVAFYSTDSSKLEVSKNPQTGNFVFNAIAPGTVKVIVYRDYTGANPTLDWLLEFNVNIVPEEYTPTPTPDPGGGGGGAASFKGTTVKAATGGQINEAGAVIDIPANAFTSDFKVKVEKVSNIANLPIPEKSKFISDVIEITKDKSGNFSKPVTITLTFDKDEVDTNKYDLALYWLDTKTNKWSILDSVKLDMDAGKVSGDINHFTKFAVIATEKAAIPPEVVLTDIAGHWAEANIKALVATGAIAGYPDNTFKPNNNITRAEFASILVRAFNLEPKAGKIFNDTANSWAKDSIATAYAYGIIQGYSDTTFGPDDLITREQMAVMVVKAANLTDITNSEAFVDNDKISDWAQDAVAIAKANGIIAGYPDNTFNPQGNATRAEAATVILNAINK